MAIGGFERADKRVSVHEGGYVNDPRDPGGATNKGVIQRVYDSYRLSKGLPKQSVRAMSEAERLEIYRSRYWNVIQGDKLPAGVDYVVYDGAVNSGPVQSVKWLQRALGSAYSGTIDGIVGPDTLRALDSTYNHDKLIRAMLDLRMAFLKRLKTWGAFGKGWSNRVNDVRATGQAWANGDTGPKITYIKDAEHKAVVEDAKAPAPAEVGTAGAAVGAGSNGLAGTLNRLQEQLTPYSTAGGWIEQLVVWLIVIGAIIGVAGIAYRWWAGRANKQRAIDLDLNPNARNIDNASVAS